MALLISLGISLVAVTVSVVLTTLRGLAAFRDFKRLNSGIGESLARIDSAVAQIEGHLTAAAESGERLSASLERLRWSRARLSVLTSAIDDVRNAVFRVTAVYPRK